MITLKHAQLYSPAGASSDVVFMVLKNGNHEQQLDKLAFRQSKNKYDT